MGRGHLAPPWKCCKVFCALAVTVKCSADQFFGLVHLVVLARVLRAMTKKNIVKKRTPRENPGYAYEFAHPWKKYTLGAHDYPNTKRTQLPCRFSGLPKIPPRTLPYSGLCHCPARLSTRSSAVQVADNMQALDSSESQTH